MPFSFGIRNCIGYKYADYAMRIILIYLLKQFKFSTQLKLSDIKIGLSLTLNVLNTPKIQIEKRN